jgi:hypothetical protein
MIGSEAIICTARTIIEMEIALLAIAPFCAYGSTCEASMSYRIIITIRQLKWKVRTSYSELKDHVCVTRIKNKTARVTMV